MFQHNTNYINAINTLRATTGANPEHNRHTGGDSAQNAAMAVAFGPDGIAVHIPGIVVFTAPHGGCGKEARDMGQFGLHP